MERQLESLKDEVEHLEQEARMILPGIQALFGFQLIAVFNERFSTDLLFGEQLIHLIAICLTVLSVILTLAPAAYHREAEPHTISRNFSNLAGHWLSWGLFPLSVGICMDIYIIAVLILKNSWHSFVLSALLLIGFIFMWYLWPWVAKKN